MKSEYQHQRRALISSLHIAEETVADLGLDEDGTMDFLLLSEVQFVIVSILRLQW